MWRRMRRFEKAGRAPSVHRQVHAEDPRVGAAPFDGPGGASDSRSLTTPYAIPLETAKEREVGRGERIEETAFLNN